MKLAFVPWEADLYTLPQWLSCSWASSWVWPLGRQHKQEIRGREESEVVVLFPRLSLREVTVGLPCPSTKGHSYGPVALSIPEETEMKEPCVSGFQELLSPSTSLKPQSSRVHCCY